jgi:hypothetical protein
MSNVIEAVGFEPLLCVHFLGTAPPLLTFNI